MLTVTLVLAAVVAVGAFLVFDDAGGDAKPATSESDPRLVREDSHRLDVAAGGKVTLVEFLDFECESCGAAYPSVERLRKEYAGTITYVVRYFPLPNHANAQNAAQAAEAAAKQDRFEAMYTKLFDTQKECGEARTSHAETFAGYAEQLGLDMTRYRADVTAQATVERINRDKADGTDLGVQGTPTFFLNGKQLQVSPTYANLKKAVDDALAAGS
ncbi:thioredoxin domain-containing protein [Dactylosporangium sp. NPDC049525]|uniref:DsbA family protein n=1 Tax=Dactylosporangium sp. NPDC049525 TaxID=3154730 RepID=UPI00344A5DA8